MIVVCQVALGWVRVREINKFSKSTQEIVQTDRQTDTIEIEGARQGLLPASATFTRKLDIYT